MYNNYYGLAFNPFDKQCLSEKDCFESRDFKEMTSRLQYLKEVRGIGVFTARPGMGKSYALRCFAKSLNPNLTHMAYLCLSTVSVSEFYKQFCYVLGVDDKGGKTCMFRTIQEQIYYLYKEKRQPLILAIDEAQYLSTGILNDIKMLMNYGYDSVNCFTLILCGESYLNSILNKPVHEALRQRITVHYNYEGLSDEEVLAYIHHKIEKAGGSKTIIDVSALSAVHGLSQGNPRLIDNIMTDAITLGSQMEKKQSIQKSFLQLLIISSLLVSFIKLYVYICKAVASAFIADFIALFQKTDIQSFEINLRKCAVDSTGMCF